MPVFSKAAPRPQGQRQEPKPQRLDSLKSPQSRRIPFQAPAAKKRSNRISVCTDPKCGSTNLDEENGHLVCQECGIIVQETNIVSDNTFIETGGGESMRAGVTVGNDASRARVYDPVGARIAGGRHAIRAVAGHPLNIVQDLQDAAMQVYKLAIANNFIQGRHTRSVAAVCLYIACRKNKGENNKWMLIDFADKCGMNVFKLSMTFKALLKELNLNDNVFGIEPVNTESLILRFAGDMMLGDKTQRIANEAVRIVQRMSRDWITEGRRPGGICGAALILAARMNNLRRAVREVVYMVKVAEVTVSKRLEEFKATESGDLTVEQFRTVDLPGAADPPAFNRMAKSKKKKVKSRKESGKKGKAPVEIEAEVDAEDVSERGASVTSLSRRTRRGKRKAPIVLDDDTTDDDSEGAGSTTSLNTNIQLPTPANTQAQRNHRTMPPPPVPIDPALLHVSNQRLAELQTGSSPSSAGPALSTRSRGRPPGKTQPLPEPSARDKQVEEEIETQIQEILGNEINLDNAKHAHNYPDAPGLGAVAQKEAGLSAPPPTQSGTAVLTGGQELAEGGSLLEPCRLSPARSSRSSASNHSNFSRSSSRSQSPPLKRRRTIRSVQLITSDSTTQPLLDQIPSSEVIPEEEFADDIDVANCLLSSQESTIKERLWVNANSDYLRAFQAKMLRQQLAEQNGTAKKVIKRTRKRTRMGDLSGVYDERGPPEDAAEATKRMMQKRAFSKKINYQQIDDVYGGSRTGSEAPGAPGSQERSRRQSLAPTTTLGPDGEILVEGGDTPGSEVIEVGRVGDTRDHAIELEDVESDEDDYYNEDNEMAGVDEVVKEVLDGDEEDEVEDEDQ
ncbi:MAG: hypothetical protein Q9209_003801 [Squamulea sp. 1 TL-2023]